MKKIYIVICLVFMLTGCGGIIPGESVENLPDVIPVGDLEDSSVDNAQETPVDPVITDEEPIDFDARNEVFEILDLREDKDKTDLRGRYEVEGRPDVYFEIFDDHAVLSDFLEEYNENEYKEYGIGMCVSKALKISFHEGITTNENPNNEVSYRLTRLLFVYNIKGSNYGVGIKLISDEESVFVWPVFDEPESWVYFEKVK